MTIRRLMAALVIFSTTLGGLALGEGVASAGTKATSSLTWAGEVITTSGSQPAIRGSVIQYQVPQVTCKREENSEAIVAAGIGGWSTNDPEAYLAGTKSYCENGVPRYAPFFEAEGLRTPIAQGVLPGYWMAVTIVVRPLSTGELVTDFHLAAQTSTRVDLWTEQFALPYHSSSVTTRSAECVVARSTIVPTGEILRLANFGRHSMSCRLYLADSINSVGYSFPGGPWTLLQTKMVTSRGQTLAAFTGAFPGLFGELDPKIVWKSGT
jgi:hypothetical protein